MDRLPLIRHSERVTYKRCPKKWYWHWRKGLVPKAKVFGALDLGTWVHAALASWYSLPDRDGLSLAAWFEHHSNLAIEAARAAGAPDYQLEKADELQMLGNAMATAYQKRYGSDDDIHVLDVEVPLEFEITLDGELVAIHKLKPDMVYEDPNGDVWLMEHKTAAQIRLEHLVIDDQARPYVAMSELALRKAGLLPRGKVFRGVMYNFLRKALPDQRSQNAEGKYLNKNGSVSAKQPTPVFVRHPITLTRAGKRVALLRLRTESVLITDLTKAIREKRIDPAVIPKTPHSSCPKLCEYFTMCVVEENGGDIREMQRTMYERLDPYIYEEESAEVLTSFELS